MGFRGLQLRCLNQLGGGGLKKKFVKSTYAQSDIPGPQSSISPSDYNTYCPGACGVLILHWLHKMQLFAMFGFCVPQTACLWLVGDMWPRNAEDQDQEEPDWVKSEREQFLSYRDKNKDGKMDKDEVMEWIIPHDYDHSRAEAKHLIFESDANKVDICQCFYYVWHGLYKYIYKSFFYFILFSSRYIFNTFDRLFSSFPLLLLLFFEIRETHNTLLSGIFFLPAWDGQ